MCSWLPSSQSGMLTHSNAECLPFYMLSRQSDTPSCHPVFLRGQEISQKETETTRLNSCGAATDAHHKAKLSHKQMHTLQSKWITNRVHSLLHGPQAFNCLSVCQLSEITKKGGERRSNSFSNRSSRVWKGCGINLLRNLSRRSVSPLHIPPKCDLPGKGKLTVAWNGHILHSQKNTLTSL